jgi:hypothetical protein
MNADTELEVWQKQWQSEASIPADLHRKVERQSRNMWIALICNIVVTVVMGGGWTAWALLSKDSGAAQVAVTVWVFLAAAWIFVLRVNRGLWRPPAIDAVAFVDLSVKRCEGALKAVWFAGILFVAELAFDLSWIYVRLNLQQSWWRWLLFGSVRTDVVWICTVMFFGGLGWYRAQKRRELNRLLQMREEIVSSN